MQWLKKNSIFFGIMLAFIALGVNWERIQIDDGMGWDGGVYAIITINLDDHIMVREKQLDHYPFQRLFPCAIVWTGCKLLVGGESFARTDILKGFLWLNSFCILLSLFFYLKLADFYRLNRLVKWLGFSALFLCFPVIKYPFYYPILTDTTAFCIGFAAFYCYSRSHLWGLALCGLMGAFTYPTLLYSVLLLILFPLDHLPEQGYKRIADSLLTFLALLLIYWAFQVFVAPNAINDSNLINTRLHTISLLAVAVYFYRYISMLKPPLEDMKQGIMQSLKPIRMITGVLLVATVRLIMYIFTNGKNAYKFEDFLSNIIYQSQVNPLAFIVAHTMYYGPAILLIICLFREFSAELRRMGMGAILFVGAYLLIGVGTESRQFIAAVPLFFFVLLNVLNRFELNKKYVWIFCLTCLVLSRFWYPINIQKFEGRLIDFPYQHYFMVQGPWMNNQMYLLQGGITLLMFWGTRIFVKNLRKSVWQV